MKPRWRKVLHDLFDNKARTLLVVLSIAVGVFSIGVIAGAYQIISNDMSVSYSANIPANIELRMANFDEDVLASIHNQANVRDAEGRRVFNMRVRVPGTEKWTTLDMVAFESFEKNAINLLVPVRGESIPRKRELLLELLECDLQRADAVQLQCPHDELVLPARLINRHVALQKEFLSVRQQFAMRHRLAAKQHATQLRAGILEREVHVPGSLRAQVGDLTRHPHLAHVLFQQPREEFLRQVLRVLRRMTAPPHVGIERMPVGLAKFGERIVGMRGVASSGHQHDRPMRRDEGRPVRRFNPRRPRRVNL